MNESKITDVVKNHLNADSGTENGPDKNSTKLSVNLFPYDTVLDYLDKYAKEYLTDSQDKIWLPVESTSQAVSGIIPDVRKEIQKVLGALVRTQKEV